MTDSASRQNWLPVDFEGIPPELTSMPWGVWKGTPRKGQLGKYDKQPCNPISGRKIATNKPEQWGAFGDARRAYEAGGWDGVGVLLSVEDGMVGVDIDDAKATLAEHSAIKAACEKHMVGGGYMERSPSGKGLRGFVRGFLPPGGRRRAGKVEIYDDLRFLTVTGNGTGQITSDQAFINGYLAAMTGGKVAAPAQLLPAKVASDPAVVSQLAAALKAAEPDLWAGNWGKSKKYPSQSEADQALANKIAKIGCAAGMSSETMFSTIEDVFSQSGLGQRDKWISRADYRQRTIGKAISSQLPSQDEQFEDASKGILQEYLDRYFVATAGKKTWIFDSAAADVMNSALSLKSFTELHANRFHGGKPVVVAFMKSAKRVTYAEGIAFNPKAKKTPNQYNVWRGLAVTPKAGGCRRVLRHIRDVLCGGDSKQFKYLVRWMALLVQQPWSKPEVAIVFRSVEGTGKSIIAGMLTEIFGLHGFTASQSNQVVGQFNGHLYDKVMVVLEEAFFAGDPKAESQAKVLITNPSMAFEWKFMGAESRASYHHVWILTNREWAVPVGADARRYAVLDVSAHRMGDLPYFKALADEIANGGVAAFLHFLLQVKVAGYNPRKLPNTKALAAQKAETLRQTCPEQGWWLEALVEGELMLADGRVAMFGQPILANDLQSSYERFTRGARHVKPWSRAIQDLRKVLPAAGLVKRRPSSGGTRYHEYDLPDLAGARIAFCASTGVEINP